MWRAFNQFHFFLLSIVLFYLIRYNKRNQHIYEFLEMASVFHPGFHSY